jgi:hypothetical protein
MTFKIVSPRKALLLATALTAMVLAGNAAAAEGAPAAAPALTVAQQNAVRSAQSYLRFMPFSRAGLISQLSSNGGAGYDEADATVAVDSLDVDWNANAVKSATSYLKLMGFSCKGLVDQLSSSAGAKYTLSQATYGARQVGICP